MKSCRATWQDGPALKRCRFGRLVSSLARLQSAGKLPNAQNLLPEILPLDSEQLCPFHSSDREWKIAVESIGLFRSFLSSWDFAIRHKLVKDQYLHFHSCVFTGHPVSELPNDEEYINLAEMKIGESILMENCRFLDTVWLAHSMVARTINFDRCAFEGDVDFGQATFEQRFNFRKCTVKGTLSFREATFKVAADFESLIAHSAAFNECSFGSFFNLSNAATDEVYLIRCKLHRDLNSSMANFTGLSARNLHVDGCEFYSEVKFDGMSIKDGEIIDTLFPPDKVVSFDGLKVDGTLHLKSRSPDAKMFGHAVSFRLREIEDFPGRIIFENANTFHLRLNEVGQALRKMRPARLVFGPGCDPYRLKKEVSIPCSPEWAPLVDEMAATFGSFFRLHHPAVSELKVECEFEPASVLIRYYADADLEEEEFLRLIEEAAPQFCEFLYDPERASRELYARLAGDKKAAPQATVGVFDLFRKGASLLWGFAARAQHDPRWKLDTTRYFLSGTGSIPASQVQHVHKRFLQISLFSRSTQIIAERDAHLALPEAE